MDEIKVYCSHSEMRDPVSLVEHPRNYNTHPAEQIRLLAKIIKHQGWRNPITVSRRSGYVVKGHGRLAAAILLKCEEVPIDLQDYKDEASELADMIADNRIAELAEADQDALKGLLLDETFNDFDIELTGFNINDLELKVSYNDSDDEGLTSEQLSQKSDELIKKWGTSKGQLWSLGGHRLLCGDSSNPDDVERLMNGKKADVCFTSPPYNANTTAGQGGVFNGKKPVKLYAKEFDDNLSLDDYVKFASDCLHLAIQNTNGFVFWNVSYNNNCRSGYIQQIYKHIDLLIETICWKKSSAIPVKGCLQRSWEPIFVFSKNKRSIQVKEITSNHWEVSNMNSQHELHKACFPLELPTKGIQLVNPESNIVYEPFCGSGTTLIASEKLGRNCYGMEISPAYLSIILERFLELTNIHPKLIDDES